jgi:hypothetical protein
MTGDRGHLARPSSKTLTLEKTATAPTKARTSTAHRAVPIPLSSHGTTGPSSLPLRAACGRA